MKTKAVVYFILLVVGIFLNVGHAFSQKTKDQKKAIDAFITATTKSAEASEPVPGAEITVEQYPGPVIIKNKSGESGPAEKTQFDVILKSKMKTNDQGEFSLKLTKKQLKQLPEEFYLKVTIMPKNRKQYKTDQDFVILKLNKSDGAEFKFVVTFEKLKNKSNKGTFAVNGKTQS